MIKSNSDHVGELTKDIMLDGREYKIELKRQIAFTEDAPRLLMVSHIENDTAAELLKLSVRAVKQFTPEHHELWIVDNNSPEERIKWLFDLPGVNVVLNRTEPIPPEGRDITGAKQMDWGSYANAIGFELGIRLIDQSTHHIMMMHMDALPCRTGWLTYLKSKIKGNVAAAGVRMDKTRNPDGVLHVLGYMVDFQLFKELELDFFPNLPELDVGDKTTVALRAAGYEVFASPNTVWDHDLAAKIPKDSFLRELSVDRSFDDNGNVFFLHLGRGLRRSSGEHRKGITAEEWITTIKDRLLTPCDADSMILPPEKNNCR